MALRLFSKPKKKPRKKTSKKPSKPKKKPKKRVKKKVKKPIKKKVMKKRRVKKRMKPKRKVKKTKPRRAKKKIKKPKKKVKKRVVKKKIKKAVKVKVKVPEIEKMPDNKAYDLVKKSRLPVLRTIFINKEKDLPLIKKVGFPCYMKVSSTKIIHKSEVGGIMKVDTMEEAEEAYKKLMKIKFADSVLVQECKDGFELIVGSKYDTHLDHVVSIGLGGIYV